MWRNYDNYYSQGTYEELQDGGFDYANDLKGRRSYDYHQQSRPYRGAESPFSYDLNQARDLARPTASPTQPKALSMAAGKA